MSRPITTRRVSRRPTITTSVLSMALLTTAVLTTALLSTPRINPLHHHHTQSPPPPYTQHAPPGGGDPPPLPVAESLLNGQFAAGNAALQAQTDSFQAWHNASQDQYASYQQGQQQQMDTQRINDANRHTDAQAWSLAEQGNTVLEVPFGGGDPRFAGGNQVYGDGSLYVVGDPNRIIQG